MSNCIPYGVVCWLGKEISAGIKNLQVRFYCVGNRISIFGERKKQPKQNIVYMSEGYNNLCKSHWQLPRDHLWWWYIEYLRLSTWKWVAVYYFIVSGQRRLGYPWYYAHTYPSTNLLPVILFDLGFARSGIQDARGCGVYSTQCIQATGKKA